MANYVVGQKYTPTNFVRTGAAPGQLYENATWGIGSNNPGTLKEVRNVGGVQYGDFQFASGSGWAKLSDLQFNAPAAQPTNAAPVAPTQPSPIPQPTNAASVNPYLETISKTIKTIQDDVSKSQKTDAQIMEEVKKYTTPTTPLPEAPKLVDLFGNLREEYGVGELETAVTELDDMIAAEYEYLDTARFDEEGKPVPLNVIAGRVGEQERNAQLRIDFLGRQKERAVNQLNFAYSVINTMVSLTSQDFNNAISVYTTEFNQKMTIYNAFAKERSDQATLKLDTQKLAIDTAFKGADLQLQINEAEQKAIESQQNAARANLEIFTNLMTNGNISYGDLNTETKLAISKMEVTSGLGLGFISKIQRDNPNGEVLTTVTREANGVKYADTIIRMPDGSLKTQSTVLGAVDVSGGGSLTRTQTDGYVQDAISILDEENVSGRIAEIKNRGLDSDDEEDQIARVMKEGDDNLLSRAEQERALRRIEGLVGGDKDLADQIFDQAMNAAGYESWEEDPAWGKRSIGATGTW